ncbi:hypothetical protein Aph01nite_58400 [Acrocarpospora phusangensis]|uniref:CHAT domain-containing protein n=1 Tax=Acrocarpospora phusangensis TaxID=1070424 RepID=A0A919UTL5_9ACTN|nr:hypothetical protein Aph01nite_58400 [Acrocarpospora phusangensis]
MFEVSIGPAATPGRFRVEVVRSQAGEASAEVSLDVAGLLARRAEVRRAVPASATPGSRAETEPALREVGGALFTALLGSGAVAERYQAAKAVAADRGEQLRVVLRLDTPELAGLPWEAMYDAALDRYICRREQLVRHIPVPALPVPIKVRLPLRILAVAPYPRGLLPVDQAREREQLNAALRAQIAEGVIEIHWAERPTWTGLQELLTGGDWQVVHFIGHGDAGRLCLEDEDRRQHWVEASRFADLLGQARPAPQLVVLNSCSGTAGDSGDPFPRQAVAGRLESMGSGDSADLFAGTAATLVRAGISAVTAMQFEISNGASVAFARGFYSAIAHGRGIDEAVSGGRIAILGLKDRTLEWVTPVLHIRGDRTQIFDLSATRPEDGPARFGGHWAGVLTGTPGRLDYELDLHQSGDKISGTASGRDGARRVLFELAGTVAGDVLRFRQVRVLAQDPLDVWCLIEGTLLLGTSDHSDALTGDWIATTPHLSPFCAGIHGRLHLTRT